MSIKRSLFFLCLYLVLVWIVAVLLSPQDPDFIKRGFFWTAAGIAALLVWLILQEVFGWWQRYRNRPKAAPAPAAAPVEHAEDSEFAALVAEADAVLARAPELARHRVRDLPVYLLIGSDGSGKTSLLHNSGIDARLLAGQVLGGGAAVSSTRLANIWLANSCIFLEVSGRIFQSDVARLASFLRVLNPPGQTKGWRGLLSSPAGHLQLRGVILCCDVQTLFKNSDRTALERTADTARERLFKVAEIFRMRCPVYAMFTRADAIPFFTEFFDRLPEAEAGQPFGILTADDGLRKAEEGAWAEVELKKLNREFNNLFLCLSARRLLNLSYEPTASRKPAIYEFPREFKRIRTPVVQFLVDALRPDPLRLSPVLRGFFFGGVRRVETSGEAPFDTNPGPQKGDTGSHDATRIFRPDATQFVSSAGGASRPEGRLVEKSVFTKDFFQQVLSKDRPSIAVVAPADSQVPVKLKIAVAAAAVVAVLLSSAWGISWARNRALIDEAEKSSAISGRKSQDLSLENLNALDSLRRLLIGRLDQPRELSMNWGLYTGYKIRDVVWSAYFGRLQQLMLDRANEHLAEQLRRSDAAPNNDSYDTVLGRLKTHLSITVGTCSLDAKVVQTNLRAAIAETHPGLDQRRADLVSNQIDYYVGALPANPPVQLRADDQAIKHARTFLLDANGPDKLYAGIIAEIHKGAPKVLVSAHVPGYREVIATQDEVPFEFTKEGRAKFDAIADSSRLPQTGETCVLGAANEAQASVASNEQRRDLKTLYYRKYADAWKSFLAQTNVRRFDGPGDVPHRLDLLVNEPTSALLQLLKFVSDNTTFVAPKPAVSTEAADGLANKLGFGSAKQKAQKAAEQIQSLRSPAFGPTEVNRLFDPVHVTVPADSPTLVADKNRPYVDALRALKQSFEAYNNPQTPDKAAMLPQLTQAILAATSAEQALADNFHQDTEGVNARLSTILLQPIQFAKAPPPPEIFDPNKELTKLCGEIRRTLDRYPFNMGAKEEVQTAEVMDFFAPGSGKISQLERKSLEKFIEKKGNQWQPAPDAKPPITDKGLAFLNRAQDLSTALFADGSHLGMSYELRPIEDQKPKLRLQIDGTAMDASRSSLRVTFHWPGTSDSGAMASDFVDGNMHDFAKHTGLWGIFRLFQQAESRDLNAPTVTWKYIQIATGQLQMDPVKVDIVKFPSGIDVFNPRFFAGLRACPSSSN